MQPRDAAVVLGQDVQFTVTVSSTVPLTYQWRFDGRELAGATNSNLTVSNVALSNLGRYDALVRDSTGSVTSAPSSLLLARWTELVVFGRNYELPYCGGLAWPSSLASQLGIGVRNLAVGGPNPALPSAIVDDEISLYLGSSTPTTNSLITLWSGGVDVIRGVSVEESVSRQLAMTRRLVDAGARNFLMPTLWPPELIPFWRNPNLFPNLTSDVVVEFNDRLSEGLEALKAEYALTIYRPDMFSFFTAIRQDPAAYGFAVPLGVDFICNELINVVTVQINFTPAVHRLISEEFYLSLNPPLQIDSAARTVDGNVTLNWSGGASPFRIERTADLLSGQWDPVGEVSFLPNSTTKPARPQEFFRVLSLGR